MATLEQRGAWFRVNFRFDGKRYTQTLNTQDAKKANSLKGGIEKTSLLFEQKLLRIPDGADALTFIVNGGKVPERRFRRSRFRRQANTTTRPPIGGTARAEIALKSPTQSGKLDRAHIKNLFEAAQNAKPNRNAER